jgi:hypothetical protein
MTFTKCREQRGFADKRFTLSMLFAALVCLAGCEGDLVGVTGAARPQEGSERIALPGIPDWEAKGLAAAECRLVPGKATCLALRVNSSISHPLSTPEGLTPMDFQRRYNLPSSSRGSEEIVAIVDDGDNPNAASDLATYRATFGLGVAKLQKFNEIGQPYSFPKANPEWAAEIDLDVEMVSAVCPKCTIYLVEAFSDDPDDMETAEGTAVKLGAHIVSNSWTCNLPCSLSQSYFDTPGVIYVAASGDYGYDQNTPPEAFPSVVSAGGTQLTKIGSGYAEAVWSDAGGGCSNNGGGSGQAKPIWQRDPDCAYRTDADVAAEAGCDPGVAFYDTWPSSDTGWGEECGTSAATPLIAGTFALAGNAKKLDAARRFWHASRHARRRDLHYISIGSDGLCGGLYLCQAGTDQFYTYSGPAGWGSPNGIGEF